MNGVSKALEALGNKIISLESEISWKEKEIKELKKKIAELEETSKTKEVVEDGNL